MTAHEGLPRTARLIRPAEFARVYEQRCSAARGPLVVFAAARELRKDEPDAVDAVRPRLGISVSRRIGNAVVRNRWKRRLREAFRRVQAELPPGHDYIIVVRSGRPQPGVDGARLTEQIIVDLAARVVAGRRREKR